ncbi:hypothetical protein D4764_09G0005160 [Takifugu flavidus]|uniref:Uncharacterized protein n=1 Tax=Takifugu flavidus TaxID=433684 RepID=A0A5C6MPT9_9TELE|nr:hypothetical protein D4764_09G0005160 [Takifugu flavidus]
MGRFTPTTVLQEKNPGDPKNPTRTHRVTSSAPQASSVRTREVPRVTEQDLSLVLENWLDKLEAMSFLPPRPPPCPQNLCKWNPTLTVSEIKKDPQHFSVGRKKTTQQDL